MPHSGPPHPSLRGAGWGARPNVCCWGTPRRTVSPPVRGSSDGPLGGGDPMIRVSRGHPLRHEFGTSAIVRVRGSSHFPDDPVPQPWVGGIALPQVPVLRGPMASGDTAAGAAAIAVNSPGDAPGDVLGEEEEIYGALASLLSASWPTPAVVDDTYQQFS